MRYHWVQVSNTLPHYMTDLLTRLLQSRPFLLADGATGTNFFAMGLQTGDAPELWNTEHPEKVSELHLNFIDAGSDIILTNTFGGTRHRLKLHGADKRVAELNEAAARVARGVADSTERDVVVAGDMGPTGELFQPLGLLDFEMGKAAFAEQARALAAGGADVIWIETMSSREEVEAAVAGAATTGLPIVCTASFDTNGHTMMGLSPADLAELCASLTPLPLAFGANCGVGAAETLTCALGLSAAVLSGTVLVIKANCGIPEYVDGAIRYDGTPELMADYARLARDAGARIIGGCCGTTPAHVAAIREALDSHVPESEPTLEKVVARLGTVSVGAQAQAGGADEAPPSPARRPSRRRRSRRSGQ